MRLRTNIVKKLLLSGATAFSIVGFAAPAVFAWDGGYDGGGYNYSNSYSSSYNDSDSDNYGDGNCMMQYDNYNGWNGNYNNRYCMSSMNYSYSSYSNYDRPCDNRNQSW